VKSLMKAMCLVGLLCACATSRPDHFYILSEKPQGTNEASTNQAKAPPATQVSLRVTLPSLVDRSEMILNTSTNGIVVLEHERWAAPLADLVTQTLARDLEGRRSDMLVADRSLGRSGAAVVKVTVDVVQMTVRKGDRTSLETHWRIIDPRTGGDVVGGDVFSAPLAQEGYAAVAAALSDCLGLLADRLAREMR
jgi:uncharacterized lipoprotein YmbA